MVLKIKRLSEDAVLPNYATKGDAGLDIYSNSEYTIKPNERQLISTGIAMQIPEGYVGLIWDKSGIAAKFGIKTMAGVVDSSYRGEIKVLLHNLSKEDFKIEKNTKVAQMLIQKINQEEIIEVDDLTQTVRGEGGFGSTGLK